jgi:hypothetical protein
VDDCVTEVRMIPGELAQLAGATPGHGGALAANALAKQATP